jgi:uncharacterized phiE125 gp8 family phage protein
MSLVLVTAPTTEPATLTEAKSHLRVTTTDEDTYITSLITAARGIAESFLNRALLAQTWDWQLGGFRPCLEVPHAPLSSVTYIKYIDGTGVLQTLAVSEYEVVDAGSTSGPGRIVPAYGKSWPAVRGLPNDVTVRFVAGYGASADTVPAPIKWAVLLILAELYARRESALVGAPIVSVPYSAEALLLPYVLHGF